MTTGFPILLGCHMEALNHTTTLTQFLY